MVLCDVVEIISCNLILMLGYLIPALGIKQLQVVGINNGGSASYTLSNISLIIDLVLKIL